jgi:hypothetical protein
LLGKNVHKECIKTREIVPACEIPAIKNWNSSGLSYQKITSDGTSTSGKDRSKNSPWEHSLNIKYTYMF